LQSDNAIISNLVQRLNGNIILILGNHDRWGKQKFRDCGFAEVYKKIEIGNYEKLILLKNINNYYR
jgi:calcineurin-like phosphoesterase family protein